MMDETAAAQRDVERARSDLGETIDALKHKMSASELFNEFRTQFFPDGGSEAMSKTVSTLSRQVQANPLALAMIGAGMAWLMFGRGMRRQDRYDQDYAYGDTTSGAYGGYGDAYPAPGERSPYGDVDVDADASGVEGSGTSSSGNGGQGAMHRARETMHEAGQTARDAMHATGERLSSAFGSARDTFSSARDTFSSATSTTSERATQSARYVRRTSADLLEQYPLVVGTAALALGAAIGAALPVSRFEERQLRGYAGSSDDDTWRESGEQRDMARSDLSGVGSETGQSSTTVPQESALGEGERNSRGWPEGSVS